MKLPISATILTKNSQKYLDEVLSNLQLFQEIVIYDTGSTDQTLEIAKRYPNTAIYERPFIGFGPTHNAASAIAKYDWIFSIDSDEVATPDLTLEIQNLELQRGTVYSSPRRNEYNGKWIRWCGWHPDRVVRLYNRLDTQFSNVMVHEAIEMNHLRHVRLDAPLRHYSYANVADFLQKMQDYSSLFALQNQGKRSSSLLKAICRGIFTFFRSYVLKRGFLGGGEGFEISFYNANTAFYKYLKLAEANRKIKQGTASEKRDTSAPQTESNVHITQ